ncbi:MAG: IS110 family transposase [Thermoanaerobacteraceae bacterium]|nr:IS110 family transposase [Thermoanaerobacteraceae bacterium]
MANLVKKKLRKKIPEIIQALNGHLDKHHAMTLQHILDHLAFLEEQIEKVESMIDEKCQSYQELVDIIDSIPGIDKIAAQSIIAEIGTNMSVFHSQDHLASWCGLCPGNNESAGKKKRTKVRPGNNYVKTILCQCAHAASNSKNTYLAARYWSIKARRGPQKATIATARKIIISIYHMIKNREYYCEYGHEAYVMAMDKNRVKSLKKKLESLGYEVMKKAETV